MKTLSRKLSIAASSILACNSAAFMLPLTSCGNSNAIQLANFESYMSDDLIKDLQSKYAINFPYYTVAEMIPAKFEKFYDIAVPCGYELLALVRNGWLEKLDWAKFEVKKSEDAPDIIRNAKEAKELFRTDPIDAMNEQFGLYISNLPDSDQLKKNVIKDETFDPSTKEFNILNYGVPYFAQSFMFAYTGTKIDFYKSYGDHAKTDKPTWSDIYYTISPANPKQDVRFANKKIGMVDDAKSLYDVARMVETTVNGDTSNITNVIPADDESKDRMITTYENITDKFENKSSFVLNSDSAIVSRGLADRKANQAGIMSWSGDTIVAAQGAEEFDAFTSDEFHIQKPYGGSLDEIEFMVINNKNLKYPTKRDNIYKVVKQCTLDGCDKDKDEICETLPEEDDRYKYWSMVNWDFVMYTPVLKNIYDAVVVKNEKGVRESGYWADQIQEEGEQPEKGKYTIKTILELFVPILDGNLPDGDTTPSKKYHIYGKTLTALQNSNTHWAWLESRGKL